MSPGYSVGIDVGGTFTDLVAVDSEGQALAAKVLSTPSDQSVGVAEVLSQAVGAQTVSRIVHGTTVVTNMLLERTGARVILCATAEVSDLLELRRQERASLYDLSRHHPAPLVTSDAVVGVLERIEPQGTTRALTVDEATRVAEEVARRQPGIVAVALLHAYRDPSHEQMLRHAIQARMPGMDVVLSSDVLPEIREYERTATTVCEAYARPGVGRYLERLTGRVATLGMPAPGVVTSAGGMRDAADAAQAAASLALSGPAGGVAGAALAARAAGFTQALSIDIGGTSADVGLILNGEPLVEAGGSVAGVPIALPRVLVETVSAGGGSIGWVDDGGALRVGPRSAGAVPGPAAFGRGGTLPTVTDAHVVLEAIRAQRMGEGLALDVPAARAAVTRLAQQLGVAVERCARAMVDTADAEMARALRRVSVERGIDPRDGVLVAFGGGGPLHACGLADRLGMRRILVPPYAGVLSALGLAVAPETRVAMVSVMRAPSLEEQAFLQHKASEAAERAGHAGTPTWIARMRFRGQGHELEVPWVPSHGVVALQTAFGDLHQRRYGFVLDSETEVVSLRCTRTQAAPPLRFERRGPSAWRASGGTQDDGGRFEARVDGRAVIALPDATLLVADGWTGGSLPTGGWLLERS